MSSKPWYLSLHPKVFAISLSLLIISKILLTQAATEPHRRGGGDPAGTEEELRPEGDLSGRAARSQKSQEKNCKEAFAEVFDNYVKTRAEHSFDKLLLVFQTIQSQKREPAVADSASEQQVFFESINQILLHSTVNSLVAEKDNVTEKTRYEYSYDRGHKSPIKDRSGYFANNRGLITDAAEHELAPIHSTLNSAFIKDGPAENLEMEKLFDETMDSKEDKKLHRTMLFLNAMLRKSVTKKNGPLAQAQNTPGIINQEEIVAEQKFNNDEIYFNESDMDIFKRYSAKFVGDQVGHGDHAGPEEENILVKLLKMLKDADSADSISALRRKVLSGPDLQNEDFPSQDEDGGKLHTFLQKKWVDILEDNKDNRYQSCREYVSKPTTTAKGGATVLKFERQMCLENFDSIFNVDDEENSFFNPAITDLSKQMEHIRSKLAENLYSGTDEARRVAYNKNHGTVKFGNEEVESMKKPRNADNTSGALAGNDSGQSSPYIDPYASAPNSYQNANGNGMASMATAGLNWPLLMPPFPAVYPFSFLGAGLPFPGAF
jgi:hypothetical protein